MLQNSCIDTGLIVYWAQLEVVYREVCTEGSRTAKVCTDEQKVHKRHNNKDEYPQQYEVQNSVLNMLLNQIIVM